MHWRTPPAQADWADDLATTLAPAASHLGLYLHIPFCQALCTFCGCNIRVVRNHALAAPYVDTVLREFALYRERLPGVPLRVGELHLGGGTPTFLPAEALDRLLDGILQHCEVMPGADLAIEADPRNTTRAQLAVLRRHGFSRLSVGVQDFDARVQEIINRVQDADLVRRVVETARELGMTNISFDLIHGLPLQTPESLRQTFDLTASLAPQRISFLPYAHVPWIKSSQRQYTEADLPGRHLRQQLFALGRERMSAWGMVEIGLDQYARADDALAKALAHGTLHRNFMGFTASRTQALIGLGVSAIGHGAASYAQNEKGLQQYETRLAAGELPLQRGHVLGQDDRRIRAHLWNLLCTSRTTVTAAERNLQWWQLASDRLQAMQEDGLVQMQGDLLMVTPTGRAFLRHVCAALDAHQQALARQPVLATG
jgi:oxygen-independent coproporphyrinogen-3 oxidase